MFVHDRPAELAFVEHGFGIERREVMYNDFVLVGPKSDPAHVDGGTDIVAALRHIAEHSIELHLPWLQYCFGNVPLVAALIPDPLKGMIADDGERTAARPFVDALRETLADAGGRTLYIASSDLSHVGPQFGEPRAVDERRRFDVERHDREMMAKFISADPEEFLAAFRWNKNPTRWCSIGNMAAILELAQPQAVEVILVSPSMTCSTSTSISLCQ